MLAGLCPSVLLTRSPLAWPNEPGRHMHIIMPPARRPSGDLPGARLCAPPFFRCRPMNMGLGIPVGTRGPLQPGLALWLVGPGVCSVVRVGWPRALSQLLLPSGLQLVLLCSAGRLCSRSRDLE